MVVPNWGQLHTYDGRVQRCAYYGFRFMRFYAHSSIQTSKRNLYEALLCKTIEELLRPERQLALHLFAATKVTIARAWKTPILSFEAVKRQMINIMVSEKLTAILLDTH